MKLRDIIAVLRANISVNWSVMRPNNCSHGPQDWTRRWVGFSFVRIEWMITTEIPCAGWRVWIYTRGSAWTFDLYLEAPKDALNFGERMARRRQATRDAERLWTLLRRPVVA